MDKFLMIPTDWFKSDMTFTEMFLMAEIVNLSKVGECFASNSYFAELLNMQKQNVSRSLNSLQKKGLISINIKKGSRNYEREITILNANILCNQNDKRYNQNDIGVLSKRLETKDKIRVLNNIYSQVLDYLNEKTGKRFRATTKTKTLIDARLNEKYTLNDFKRVIDIKTNEWLGDGTMSKYLRPETLFSNKFDGYLNQEVTKVQEWRM